MHQSPNLSVEIVPTITQVDRQQWDALATDNVAASWGWLRAVEEETPGPFETRYILLRRGGELEAATPCYICHRNCRLFSLDKLMFGRIKQAARRCGLSFQPMILVGTHRPTGGTFMLSGRIPPAPEDLAAMHEAIGELARSEKLPLFFARIPRARTEIRQSLLDGGCFQSRANPVCYLDLEWGSFAEYLASLKGFSKNMRSNIKEEISRCRRAGVVIEQIDEPARQADRIFELVDNHHRRLNGTGASISPRFLPKLKEYLGHDAVFYGASREGRLVGFVLMVKRNGIGYLTNLGVEPRGEENHCMYFNLCFYQPLKDAIAAGMQRLYYGNAVYRTKARRGAEVMAVDHYYRGVSPARHAALTPWLALHSAWMTKKIRPLEDVESLRTYPASRGCETSSQV